jgi:DNA polymerase-3 subunit delta'
VTEAASPLVERARTGRLYPSVILHGSSVEGRRRTALELGRALLCDRPESERPCGACRHCSRIGWPGEERGGFHPDFAVLERDLKTATSADSTRDFLRVAHSAPFEARGQVFVVAEADTLSAEAGDALLKLLEEPPLASPRHFLLLAPSREDLPETLRSRSLAHYLGPAGPVDGEARQRLAREFAASVGRWAAGGGGIYLLDAAARLGGKQFEDPRAEAPWAVAAAAVLEAVRHGALPVALRRPLLALAEDLLAAPALRLRGIPADRILEGLVARHLTA